VIPRSIESFGSGLAPGDVLPDCADARMEGLDARGGRAKLRKDLRVVRQLVTGCVDRCRSRDAEALLLPSAHYVSCWRPMALWSAGFGWNSRRPPRPSLAGRHIGPARQAGDRTQPVLSSLAQRASVRIDRGVSDRSVPGVGAPLISRGGRQGIGHQSYFPGGSLTTAQLVGYLKPFTGWILRLAMARFAASCDRA
jgi:hypothetical protein